MPPKRRAPPRPRPLPQSAVFRRHPRGAGHHVLASGRDPPHLAVAPAGAGRHPGAGGDPPYPRGSGGGGGVHRGAAAQQGVRGAGRSRRRACRGGPRLGLRGTSGSRPQRGHGDGGPRPRRLGSGDPRHRVRHGHGRLARRSSWQRRGPRRDLLRAWRRHGRGRSGQRLGPRVQSRGRRRPAFRRASGAQRRRRRPSQRVARGGGDDSERG